MRFHFDDTRRPARVAKLLRAAFAAKGKELWLTEAQDISARLYGYANYQELRTCCGRAPASAWDEACPPEIKAGRRRNHLATLVAAGLPREAAEAFLADARPTARTRRDGAMGQSASVHDGGTTSGYGLAGDSELPLGCGEVMDRLIRDALRDKVSEIRIVPGADSYRVLFLRFGDALLARTGCLTECASTISSVEKRARIRVGPRREDQYGAFRIEHEGRSVHMLVVTQHTKVDRRVTIRLENLDGTRMDLEDVGISDLAAWRRGISRKGGLSLVCGPNGSGKSTTLDASARYLDRSGKKVYVAEEPVRFGIPHDGPITVDPEVGHGSTQAFRHFAHAEPDAMVLGEVRHADTVVNAIKAAEAGHSVIGHLSATSVSGAIRRLALTASMEPRRLASVLGAVLVQSLVRTPCGGCGGRRANDAHACTACLGTGHGGQTVISECIEFADPANAERAVRAALDGVDWRPDPAWKDILDDGIDKMLAGQVLPGELFGRFGETFRERCEARGADASFRAEPWITA